TFGTRNGKHAPAYCPRLPKAGRTRNTNGDVRCTGDAEVMAVMYGRDVRCGRIPSQPNPTDGRSWAKRERVSAGDRIAEGVRPVVRTEEHKPSGQQRRVAPFGSHSRQRWLEWGTRARELAGGR